MMQEPLVASNPLSRRLRLLDPLKGARDATPHACESIPRAIPSAIRLHLHPRLQATGSLLPQPQTARGASNAGGELAELYEMTTIQNMHTILLQSALDTDTSSAVERILAAAKMIAACKFANLFLVEKDDKNAVKLRVKGRRSDKDLLPCEGLAGACVREKRAIISNRPHHDSRFSAEVDWAPTPGVKTIACVPVYTLLGRLVGVLQVANKMIGGFTNMDVSFLELLGRQATLTLELCNQFERCDMQNRKLTTMIRRFIDLAKCSDMIELVHSTGIVCKEVCDADRANCFILDNESLNLCTWSKSTESKTETFKESRVPLKGIFEQLLSPSRTDLDPSLRVESSSMAARSHLGSLYCPVSHHARAVGVLQVRQSRHRKFTDHDRSNLELIGGMAGALHHNLMKMNPAASQELQAAWNDIESAERSIRSFMNAVSHAQHTFLLILDTESSLLRTKRLDHFGDYFWFEGKDFPFANSLQNNSSLCFSLPTKDKLSEKQLSKLKSISKKLCPNEPMESVMIVPLHAFGKSIGAVLSMKSENKGCFDPWLVETVQVASHAWGLKLQNILERERNSTTNSHFSTTLSALKDMYHIDDVSNCYFRVAQLAQELFSFDKCWFFRLDGNASITVKLHPDQEPTRVELSEAGMAGGAITTKTYQMSSDVHEDSRHSHYLSILDHYDVKDLLCVPVFSVQSESTVIGALQLMNKRGVGSKINDSDLLKLQQFSALAAALVQNTMNRSELKAVRDRLSFQEDKQNFLLEQASTVHDLLCFDSLNLVKDIKAMVRSIFGPVDCLLFLAGHAGRDMYELKDDLTGHAYLEPAGGIAGHVIRTGAQVFHCPDESCEHFDPAIDQRNVRGIATAVLCVPLVHGQKQVGCIQLVSRTQEGNRPLTPQDGRLLIQLGKHMSCAILNNVLLSKVYASVNMTGPVNLEAEVEQQLVRYGGIVRDIVKAERANVFVREGSMATAIDEFSGRRISLRSDQGFVGLCCMSSKTLIVNNLLQVKFDDDEGARKKC